MSKTRVMRLVVGFLAMAASCVTLYDAAAPGGTLDIFMLAAVLWLVAGAGWYAVLLVLLMRRRALPAVVVPAVVVPVLLVVTTFILTRTDLPVRAGFAVSQGDLTRRLAAQEAGRAGIYLVNRPVLGEGPVRLPLQDCGFLVDECGFLHAPSGVPSGYLGEVESVRYRHLEGAWYWYVLAMD